MNSEEMLHEAKDLHRTWEHLSYDQKKEIVENIVKSIVVGKEDIEINLLYLPVSSPNNHPFLTGGKKGKQPFPYSVLNTPFKNRHNKLIISKKKN